MTSLLRALLAPDHLTEVLDVGASPLDGGAPPYQAMLASGLCRVTGFEPHEEAFARLEASKGPNERYFPHALGDGNEHVLRVCAGAGMTSLLEPDPVMLGLFAILTGPGQVVRRIPTTTRRLDDFHDVETVDFLKLDVQGSELAVLRAGTAKLSKAVAIQTEVSFITLYRGQPSFGDVDLELRRQGFVPHCFAQIKHLPIAPVVVDGNPRAGLRQLVEADMVYVRDFSKPEAMSDEQLKHLALIADHCYGSIDLALRCVVLLEARGALKPGAKSAYLEMVQGALAAATRPIA
jgi:FkbM family methyltransferase